MKVPNYYEILGVAKNASADDIQKAYRKLARRYHPDVSKDKDAERKFKELSEARDVLKDPEKRKLYDTYGENWQQAAGGTQQKSSDQRRENRRSSGTTFHFSQGKFGEREDFDDILESLFRKGTAEDTWQSAEGFGRQAEKTVDAEITVTLHDVWHGTTKTLTLQSFEPTADGSFRPVTKTLQVTIPKTIADGAVIRLAGQGQRGTGPGAAGDLLLRVRIAEDRHFKLQGHDLFTIVAVTPWEAALGATVPVTTMGGTVTLTVPRGSQSGGKLRLRGKGMPKRGGGAGDLIVQLEIRLPDQMSAEEERLLKELSRVSRYNPRLKVEQRAGN